MIFVFVTEQLDAALHQYRSPGHEGAVPRPFHESTQLEQTVEVFLSALPLFNFRHQRRQVDRPHPAWRTLTAALILEKIGKMQRLGDHAGRIIDDDDTGGS